MSSATQRRNKSSSSAAKVDAEAFHGGEGKHGIYKNGTGISAMLFAPFHEESATLGKTLIAFFSEFIATFVCCFFTGLVRNATNAETNLALSGLLIGLTRFATYWMGSQFRVNGDISGRHMSWAVSILYTCLLRVGLVTLFLFYLLSQTAAAMASAGLLYNQGATANILPAPAVISNAWFWEILGAFVVTLVIAGKHLVGTTKEEEKVDGEHWARSRFLGAIAYGAVTAAGFAYAGAYQFDPVLAMSSYTSTCMTGTCTITGIFGSNTFVFYFFTPLIGAAVTLVMIWLGVVFFGNVNKPEIGNIRVMGEGKRKADAIEAGISAPTKHQVDRDELDIPKRGGGK
jgi:hypothetical protein